MIEMDPDTEYFFELANPETMFPVSNMLYSIFWFIAQLYIFSVRYNSSCFLDFCCKI